LKVAIILNGLSGRKKLFYSRLLPVIRACATATVFETRSRTDAFDFSAKAVSKNYDLILAAGGDGTIHQVVNGMLSSNVPVDQLPMLTILPVGSGNDFARTVNITLRAADLKKRLTCLMPRLIDVGSTTFQKDSREYHSYFINVASAGMGPEVLNKMNSGKKRLGSAAAYYTAILSTFLSYRCMRVTIKTSAWEWSNNLRTLAIGNGKFFGSGLCIAPEAKPDDGMFSAFVCEAVSVLDFIRYTSTLKSSRKVIHPKIHYKTAEKLELTSKTPCRIEADGELLGFLPACVEVIPGRIKFLY
jgi:YegS/Rv2252/BmrU family lipid kinase